MNRVVAEEDYGEMGSDNSYLNILMVLVINSVIILTAVYSVLVSHSEEEEKEQWSYQFCTCTFLQQDPLNPAKLVH